MPGVVDSLWMLSTYRGLTAQQEALWANPKLRD